MGDIQIRRWILSICPIYLVLMDNFLVVVLKQKNQIRGRLSLFSLKSDTHCGRVQFSVLKTRAFSEENLGLILRQLPYGSFQQTAGTVSFSVSVSVSFAMGVGWGQYLRILDPEKGSGCLFKEQRSCLFLCI